MWIKQKDWRAFSPETVKHIERCVSELRHKKIKLRTLTDETWWNPWYLITPFGMLRAGKLTSKSKIFAPWAPDGSILVGTVVVLKRFRGAGHANGLMQNLIARYGHKTLVLTVDPQNKPAIALYKKYGFRVISKSPDDTGMIRT